MINYSSMHLLEVTSCAVFVVDHEVFREMRLSKDDTFIILWFVSGDASHDVGQHGIQNKTTLVRELERCGQVFITSKERLDGGLAKYQIKVSPEKMQDLPYYATLLYGESATMASECAVLGTHAIYCDFAGWGYTYEEAKNYGRVYNFKLDVDSLRSSLEKAVELLRDNNLKSIGREKLLEDKIDVITFMVWFVKNYPESFVRMKEFKGGV